MDVCLDYIREALRTSLEDKITRSPASLSKITNNYRDVISLGMCCISGLNQQVLTTGLPKALVMTENQ